MSQLTKENLERIIKGTKEIIALKSSRKHPEILESIVSLLDLAFGRFNATLIIKFSLQYKSSFNSIDELYEYLSDPHSYLVNNHSALTVDQLAQLFPDDDMFKTFQKVIQEHTNT